jgi:hypothetical protein
MAAAIVEPFFREQRFDNNNPGAKARREDQRDGGRNS